MARPCIATSRLTPAGVIARPGSREAQAWDGVQLRTTRCAGPACSSDDGRDGGTDSGTLLPCPERRMLELEHRGQGTRHSRASHATTSMLCSGTRERDGASQGPTLWAPWTAPPPALPAGLMAPA
ncbi:hypothetical protein NUW54_g11079 [Trametes sanguinea]|uniref:Uncharacterized protein n=1 Tax=Trametes sanguinea TaxID=158606 RepID=A0ACC1NMR5_9APHY|nr:hypothetical protein NUW54_g11079 [Trametes sanguinea]